MHFELLYCKTLRISVHGSRLSAAAQCVQSNFSAERLMRRLTSGNNAEDHVANMDFATNARELAKIPLGVLGPKDHASETDFATNARI